MFREQIRKHYDHLSRSYRRVADFILSDYRTAAFMTAAALADAVDVDTTTVVRFAQRLGYPGFPELIEDIQEQVKLELSQTYATPSDEGGLYGKVQSLVAKDRANLEKALAHNTPDSLENIIDMLRAAPRIVVTGESFAAPLAESFAGMLREAGLPVVYTSGDVYERATALSRVVRKEVVIGMTPVEGPSGVARLLKYARGEGGDHAGVHAQPEQPGRPLCRAPALRPWRDGGQPPQLDRPLRAHAPPSRRRWPACSPKLHPSDRPRSPTPCQSCPNGHALPVGFSVRIPRPSIPPAQYDGRGRQHAVVGADLGWPGKP